MDFSRHLKNFHVLLRFLADLVPFLPAPATLSQKMLFHRFVWDNTHDPHAFQIKRKSV